MTIIEQPEEKKPPGGGWAKSRIVHTGPTDTVERFFFCTLPPTPMSIELRA